MKEQALLGFIPNILIVYVAILFTTATVMLHQPFPSANMQIYLPASGALYLE